MKRKPKYKLVREIVQGCHLTKDQGSRLLKVFEMKFKDQRGVTPKALIAEARKKTSPIHDLFEWNTRRAAEKYWHDRALYLIRCVSVKVVNITTGEVECRGLRSHVRIPPIVPGKRLSPKKYIPIETVNVDTAEYILQRAYDDFRNFYNRYKRYTEFLEVFAGVLKAFKRISPARLKARRRKAG